MVDKGNLPVQPRSKTNKHNWDLACGANGKLYVIRTDLPVGDDDEQTATYVLEIDSATRKPGGVTKLSGAMVDGESYFGLYNELGCIKDGHYGWIEGIDQASPRYFGPWKVHESWKQYDHFCVANQRFVAISNDGRIASSWGSDDVLSYEAPPAGNVAEVAKGALCYAGDRWSYWFLKLEADGHIALYQITDITVDEAAPLKFILDEDILSFFPGNQLGAGYSEGHSNLNDLVQFQKIKDFDNRGSSESAHFSVTVSREIGVDQTLATSTETHWGISTTASTSYEASVFAMVARAELSLTVDVGGNHITTDTRAWSFHEAVTEEFNVELEGGEGVSLWRAVAKLGGNPVLYGSSLITAELGETPKIEQFDYAKTLFTSGWSQKELGDIRQGPGARPLVDAQSS